MALFALLDSLFNTQPTVDESKYDLQILLSKITEKRELKKKNTTARDQIPQILFTV